jgi:hypothetical protein
MANGDKRTIIQPIAITQDGSRIPFIEKQGIQYLKYSSCRSHLTVEQRKDLLSKYIEPTLQRELNHKGTNNGDGSYSAELIGYIEISNK